MLISCSIISIIVFVLTVCMASFGAVKVMPSSMIRAFPLFVSSSLQKIAIFCQERPTGQEFDETLADTTQQKSHRHVMCNASSMRGLLVITYIRR